MSKKILSLLFFLSAVLIISTNLSNSSGPGGQYAGVPGTTTCAGCHSGNPLNASGGSSSITGVSGSYVPGQSYSITYTVNRTTASAYGFQGTVVTGSNLGAGSFTSNPPGTSTYAVSGRNYIQHNSPSSSGSWTFTWQAPATNVGNVTFYFVGNAVNGNGTTSGDFVYTSTLTLTPGSVPITASASSTNASCFGTCDGTATITASGGSGNLNYNWGQTGIPNQASVTGLCSGVYTVTVSDNSGGNTTVVVQITQPQEILTNHVVLNTETCATQDAVVAVYPSQFVNSYTTVWKNSQNTVIGNTDTLANVSAGTYTVEITDGNSCTKVQNIVVNRTNNPFNTDITVNPGSCAANDGSASANPLGGIAPYSYLWSTGDTASTAANLSPASYSLTVSDANGCESISTFSIAPGPVFNEIVSDVSCFGDSTGSIDLNISGGTVPYQITWDSFPNNQSQVQQNLRAGMYGVEVVDSLGCLFRKDIEVSESDAITELFVVDDVACYGDSNGLAAVTISGGVAPYSYFWSILGVDSTSTQITAAAGVYDLTVVDALQCEGVFSTEIMQEDSIRVNATVKHNTSGSKVNCDGSISLEVTGGVSPYTYLWNISANTSEITGLCADFTYIVTITDANGCEKIGAYPIIDTLPIGLESVSNFGNINVFPNPLRTDFTLISDMKIDLSQVSLLDVGGRMITLQNRVIQRNDFQFQISVDDLESGIYFLKISDANQQKIVRLVKL